MLKPAVSQLNASTVDILNTIRANASPEYQSQIPAITKATDIPVVGEMIYGYPAFANQFLGSLMSRIADVRLKSATFNNKFKELKKGFLNYGETVEECFVSATKAREFSFDKAESRELKKTLPDVKTAFHSKNWAVQYPISISHNELKTAFLTEDSFMNFINKLLTAPIVGNEYDEYLLFKYLIIKAVNQNAVAQIKLDDAEPDTLAISMQEIVTNFGIMSSDYNVERVTTATDPNDIYVFMDSKSKATYGVKTLAGAFNMDEAKVNGHIKLVNTWDTFDNERFSEITANCDMVEPVTAEELELMKNVKAFVADKEFFQVYDNYAMMTDKQVASGLYWNYFYNVGKIVSYSPFSNCCVIMSDTREPAGAITLTVTDISKSNNATIVTVKETDPKYEDFRLTQNEDATKKGIAVHPYGVFIYPKGQTTFTPTGSVRGATYTAAASADTATLAVDGTITMNKDT